MNSNDHIAPPARLVRHGIFDVNQVTKQIRLQGYCIVDNYVSNVSELQRESEALIEGYAEHNAKGVYPNGDIAVVQCPADLVTTQPHLFRLFSDPQLRQVYRNISAKNDRYFNTLYVTHDYRTDRGPARNGFLHFDRNWAFKCMLYLNDVGQHCGSFSIVPGSMQLGRSLRKKAWQQESQYADVKNRIEIDYPELELNRNDGRPIYGKAGTLIIFDSDILHFGGFTEPNYERWLVRSHSY